MQKTLLTPNQKFCILTLQTVMFPCPSRTVSIIFSNPGQAVMDTCIDALFIIKLHYSMYKKPLIKALPATFMLGLSLLVSFFGSEGTLLCFGEDGHMAIEFVEACNGSGFGSQLAGMEPDDCGNCRDIQFLSSPAFTQNTSHGTQTLPLISSSSMSPAAPLKVHPGKYINLPEYLHHKTFAGLYSVVLLI